MNRRSFVPFAGKPGVIFLPTREIRPAPSQPRTVFDRAELESLARSISLYGILQPLSVRRVGRGFVLVAGERRLRAAAMVGLEEVPCIELDVDDADAGMLTLIENLQRSDLDFLDEAQGLATLMKTYGMSQEEVARRIGKSQSAVANKLRLLRHSPAVLEILRQGGLTERHARALLRAEDEGRRLALAKQAADEGWSVAKLEQVLEKEAAPKARGIWKSLPLRDVRLFLNSVEKSLQAVRSAGIAAHCGKEETEKEIVLTIRLPKPGVPALLPSAAE